MVQKARRISLLALVPYPLGTSPSQRFRIEQWEPWLREDGIDVTLAPFVDPALMGILHQPGRHVEKLSRWLLAVLRRIRDAGRCRRFDAVFVHRAALLGGPALLERAMARFGRPLIFDFDDAIYLLHTSAANRTVGWLKLPGKTAKLCRASKAVVVANAGLAEWARRYNPRVHVVASSVDTERFFPRRGERLPGPVRIGWTGSSTSLTYLEMFQPVLQRITATLPVELHVHSDRQPVLRDVAFAWHAWSPETEPEELSRFDIGIMPMPSDDWARGKSAMKALLYMSMGIPAVASGVGTNRDVIRHGENGLLADTPEAWLATLGQLAGSAEERQRLGAAGRRTVEQEYSSGVCAGRFARVVREVVT